MVHGGVLADVDREGGLTHGGAGGDDDELALLEAAGAAVELVEVGGQAGDLAALLVQVVDGPEGSGNDLVEALKARGDALIADFKQSRLGGAQHLESGLALVGGAGDGLRADEHEPAQQALVLDDPDVFLDHRTARQAFSQRREIRHAAHRFDLLELGQLVGEGDDVDRALLSQQVAHALVDALVRVKGEIVGFELFRGFRVRGIVKQDGAEDGLLGVDRRGHARVESSGAGVGGHESSLGGIEAEDRCGHQGRNLQKQDRAGSRVPRYCQITFSEVLVRVMAALRRYGIFAKV